MISILSYCTVKWRIVY